jgi:hypothetical protein
LEDGQLLDAVLDRVEPPDHQLDGGVLGWIFNPVFVNGGPDQKTKAWTDFAGGGMAVLEDRFSAKSYFEFRALEVARAVDLLYSLRLAVAAESSMLTFEALMAVIDAAETSRSDDAVGPLRGPAEGLLDMIRVWNFQHQLHRIRNSTERLWPESFVELRNWIRTCMLDCDTPHPGSEQSLIRALTELAFRRFPLIDRGTREIGEGPTSPELDGQR